MEMELIWEGPPLAERILLMGVEQSQKMQNMQLDQARELSQSMIDELKRAIYWDMETGEATL